MTRRILVLALLVPISVATAQGGQAGKNRELARQQRIEQQQQAQMDSDSPRRQQLQQQVRKNFWRVAKNRIGFTDDQMARLEQTSARFDVRRQELAQQEKQQRVLLRGQLSSRDSSANPAAVSTALDRLQQVQRDRFDLQAEEQKEFASFMTPVQRAKYTALQEQLRRRMQDIVRARPDSMPE